MERCESLRPQGPKLLSGKLQLGALRLKTGELHDIGKRRQNFWRLLRRSWLDKRLPGMRRMQRLGKNGLPRMERVGAAMGQRFQRIFSSSSFRRAHGRKDRRKIPHWPIPGGLRGGRCRNCARRMNIPDRGRIQDQEHLQDNRSRERVLWEFLVDPAITKVRVAQKFLRRCGSPNQRFQAGEEFLECSRSPQSKPRSRQLRRRVERDS